MSFRNEPTCSSHSLSPNIPVPNLCCSSPPLSILYLFHNKNPHHLSPSLPASLSLAHTHTSPSVWLCSHMLLSFVSISSFLLPSSLTPQHLTKTQRLEIKAGKAGRVSGKGSIQAPDWIGVASWDRLDREQHLGIPGHWRLSPWPCSLGMGQ